MQQTPCKTKLAFATGILWGCLAARTATLAQTFTIQEVFGVAHPVQIVDFDLAAPVDAANSYLLGPDGAETPYQLLDGGKRLAVRTDLPAGASKTWTLKTGRPPAPVRDGVVVIETPQYYEIVNGLTGVRVPKPPEGPGSTPAPVQGIRYRDGTWTATGPNLMRPAATGMTVRFVERGPLAVVVEVSYRYDRPEVIRQEATYPAGEGYYRSTLTVQAGQPSILFEEDADVDVSYSMNVYDGLRPDQGRYRGHHSRSMEAGYEADGRQYRMWHARPAMDAFVDLRFDAPRTYPRVAVWDPWCFDTGWYWQLYNREAPAAANLLGLFAGRASRALGANATGAAIYTNPTGASDFTSQVDRQGRAHLLETVNGTAWLTTLDAELAPGARRQVAVGIANPDLLVDAGGRAYVAGYDAAARRFVLAEEGADGTFATAPIAFAGRADFEFVDRHLLQAASGDTHFLLVRGRDDGQEGMYLFARTFGERAFTIQEWNRVDPGRVGPLLSTTADDTVTLLFSQGQYAEFAYLRPGARTFAGTPGQMALFGKEQTRHLNFGTGYDAQTGSFFVANHEGALAFFTREGQQGVTKLGIPLDHVGGWPNRRTLAVADTGEAIAIHNGAFYRWDGTQWATFSSGNALKLISPRVHFHRPSGRFVCIGRRDDRLAVYAWKPGDMPAAVRALAAADPRVVGITVSTFRGANQPRFHPRVRMQWGLFAGVKGEDLGDPTAVQNVARQMNLHGGINLNKVHRLTLDFPDPPQGYGGMYMDPAVLRRMIERLRADEGGMHAGGYYTYLRQADPLLPGIVDMWRDATPAKAHEATDSIAALARDLLTAMVDGDGIYAFRFHYWHGGVEMMRKGAWIDQVLGSDVASAKDKARVKAAAVLFGDLLWDDDFVPLFWEHGLNLGTENMPVQQQGYRSFYAMLLANHPAMRERARLVEERTLSTLRRIVNEHGANIGCTHYIGASMSPTLITLLQLRMMGRDHFATEPRLAGFAEFFMNFQTPPEVRFGRNRKLVSIGDSPTSASEMFGMLSTGFRTADPELSARLMGAWRQGGKPHGFFFGSTLLMIDEEAPSADPALGSADFPGYYTVLRHGWGTPNETAAWMINGTWYRDHYHNDMGAVIAYAFGAPLSIDWGSQGDPRTPSSYYHSLVLPEKAIGSPWDGDNVPLDNAFRWRNPVTERFLAFEKSALMRTTFDGAWTRTVYSLSVNPETPVLLVRDTFPTAESRVLTWNLMAEGDIETPAGAATPVERDWKKKELASTGAVFELAPGLNRFGFTGQWLIDWDLYLPAEDHRQALVGNWAHRWCAGQENQFRAANGREFEERQHILRVKGDGPFTTLILPHRKGRRPDDLVVDREGENLRIATGGETTLLGPDFFAFHSATRRALAGFAAAPVQSNGLRLEGGPAEVVVEETTATIALHGNAGTRTVALPGPWRVKNPNDVAVPVATRAGVWTIEYKGGDPLVVRLEK